MDVTAIAATATQAPAAPSAATPPAAADPPASPAAKRSAAMARVRAAAPAAPAAATPPAADPAATATPPAAAEPPKGPTVAQLAANTRKLERELAQLKQAGEASKADLELLAALRDPSKRFDALQQVGVKYDEWTLHQLKAAGVETEAPADETPREKALREKLEAIEGKLTTAEKAEQTAASERDHLRRVDFARKVVTEGGEKYALTAALGLHEQLLAEHERTVREEAVDRPDPAEVAARVEASIESTLRKQLAALAGTAKGKALLTELLGGAAPATAQDDGGDADDEEGLEERKPKPAPTNRLSASRTTFNGVDAAFYKMTPAQKRDWALKRTKRASA